MDLESGVVSSILMTTSILIPCFNAAPYIEATLESVLSNMERDDEIIIVDDHSEDDSIYRAQRWLEDKDVNYILAQNPSKGACAARNHAFKISTGDFIQWLDADDILGHNKLQHQLRLIQNQRNSIVACPFRCFQGSSKTGLLNNSHDWNLPYESTPSEWIATDPTIGCHCWLTPRHIAAAAGPWDESLQINQDGEYFARVVAKSDRVLFDDKVEVFYRREGNGVSRFSAEKADSLFRSIELMAYTAFRLEDSERMRQMISNRWQDFIYTAYPHAPKLRREAKSKLVKLPRPNISNPQIVSRKSQLFSHVFGWKTLMRIRQIRGII